MYDDRDAEVLEPHYSRHVHAMTAEGLHSKSAIAAELALRDVLLENAEQKLEDEKFVKDHNLKQIRTLTTERSDLITNTVEATIAVAYDHWIRNGTPIKKGDAAMVAIDVEKIVSGSRTPLIPEMTNPLGRAWRQPETSEITIRGETAMMGAREFDQLNDYSASIPSGVYAGKMWKRSVPSGWQLCWYVDSEKPDHCDIVTRKIELRVAADGRESS